MSHYLKLVDFEMKRFWKIYIFLLVSVLIIQPITVFVLLNAKKEYIQRNPLEDYYLTHFSNDSVFFHLPIMICLATLTLYIFFTWYREWFGKSTFSIQLLMLPFNRMTVYYAKLTALLLFILGCLVTQIGSYYVVYGIYRSLYPQSSALDNSLVSWLNSDQILFALIPTNVVDFFLYYGLGIVAVIVLFTVILLERSFRYKGIIIGLIFAIVCVIWFFVPNYINDEVISLYENEILLGRIVISFCIAVGSLGLSHYLMKKKIWV